MLVDVLIKIQNWCNITIQQCYSSSITRLLRTKLKHSLHLITTPVKHQILLVLTNVHTEKNEIKQPDDLNSVQSSLIRFSVIQTLSTVPTSCRDIISAKTSARLEVGRYETVGHTNTSLDVVEITPSLPSQELSYRYACTKFG